MFDSFGSVFNRKPQRGGPAFPEPSSQSPLEQKGGERKSGYSKVFRWCPPDGQTQLPNTVEVVGTFTHWQKVPLIHDSAVGGWHVTLHHIPGNKTHHYMLLVDGKPAHDKHCDGLAIPQGPVEESFAVKTDRGSRLFMLFAQTK
jgi:Glycogen recognition site of AMP-activated protein kinase